MATYEDSDQILETYINEVKELIGEGIEVVSAKEYILERINSLPEDVEHSLLVAFGGVVLVNNSKVMLLNLNRDSGGDTSNLFIHYLTVQHFLHEKRIEYGIAGIYKARYAIPSAINVSKSVRLAETSIPWVEKNSILLYFLRVVPNSKLNVTYDKASFVSAIRSYLEVPGF